MQRGLEAAPIGGQPFAQDISRRDCTAFLLLFDTYDTRLLAQALRRISCRYFRSSCSWLWLSSLSLRLATACHWWRDKTTRQNHRMPHKMYSRKQIRKQRVRRRLEG